MKMVIDPKKVEPVLENAVIKIGNSHRYVIIFFDLLCPFCARMFLENEEVLKEYAERGLITFVMSDFIVHEEAKPLHAMLRCLPSEQRLEFIKETYSDLRKALERANQIHSSSCETNEHILASGYNLLLGVRAVPTAMFFNKLLGRGFVVEGYIPQTNMLEYLRSLF